MLAYRGDDEKENQSLIKKKNQGFCKDCQLPGQRQYFEKFM